MKAIKHSPEWPGPSRSDSRVVPYSLMTSLQVHVVGYDHQGKRYVAHRGHGSETLFYKMPQRINSEADVVNKVAGIVASFEKAKLDHKIELQNEPKEQAVVFKDHRSKKHRPVV